jgi:hypothetical protein
VRKFDEIAVLQALTRLPVEAQSALVQACAWRTLYLAEAGELPPAVAALCARALNLIPDALARGEAGAEDCGHLLEEFEDLPELDDDRVAACAFALRHMKSRGDPKEAVWAVRRAYEARDQLAQNSMDFTIYTPEIGAALLNHPAVQLELENQAMDLDALSKDPSVWRAVIDRAKVDSQ